MSNEGIRKTALWLRDLLNYDESLMYLGRQNFEREDFETPYIVLDSLGAGSLKASNIDYDGDAEIHYLGLLYTLPIQIDFYGTTDAHPRAMKMIALRRSQLARELQKTYKLSVYAPTNITDAKALTGQQYGERIQVEMNVEYLHVENIDILRIDEANIDKVWTSFFNE